MEGRIGSNQPHRACSNLHPLQPQPIYLSDGRSLFYSCNKKGWQRSYARHKKSCMIHACCTARSREDRIESTTPCLLKPPSASAAKHASSHARHRTQSTYLIVTFLPLPLPPVRSSPSKRQSLSHMRRTRIFHPSSYI
jgi:hypothetical protein